MRRRDRYRVGVTAILDPLNTREQRDRSRRHHQLVGYLYFARHYPNGHYIKIGWAVDPTTRLRTWLLEILVAVPAYRDEEDDTHDRFQHLHFEGEWFEPGPDLLEYIDALAAGIA